MPVFYTNPMKLSIDSAQHPRRKKTQKNLRVQLFPPAAFRELLDENSSTDTAKLINVTSPSLTNQNRQGVGLNNNNNIVNNGRGETDPGCTLPAAFLQGLSHAPRLFLSNGPFTAWYQLDSTLLTFGISSWSSTTRLV